MFSEKALKDQQPLITSYVDKLISRLHEQTAKAEAATVDLVRWYNYTTFDVSSKYHSYAPRKLDSALKESADYFTTDPRRPCFRRLVWLFGIRHFACTYYSRIMVVIAYKNSHGS